MTFSARSIRGTVSALAATVLVVACNEQQLTPGFQPDQVAPAIAIAKTAGDTLDVITGLSFTVNASDNLGLKTVSVALTGGLGLNIDTVFTSAVTQFVFPILVVFQANTTAGGVILITATAVDGSDNAGTAIDSVFLVNDDALTVIVDAPTDRALTSAGKQLPVAISASQRNGVRKVGYLVAGAFIGGDSTGPLTGLPPTFTFEDTLTVPASLTTGTFTITGFAEDSSSRRATSTPVIITIQDASNDQDPPIVTFTIGPRVEVDDTITVNATDPSGITEMGWLATLLDGTPVRGDTNTYPGNLTDVTAKFELGFSFAALPQSVVITAHAVDAAGNVGSSVSAVPAPPAGAAAQVAAVGIDTVIVVNGVTTPLPFGSQIADAIVNRNRSEVYLSNVTKNRLEIFQLSDSTLDPNGIDVGSRPWGIALWPIDLNGTHGDTVVVANSGGTNLSIVDAVLRRETRRHQLPLIRVQSVQTKRDPATGLIKPDITEFALSDRPQYVGMVCRSTAGVCDADGIIAVYSTTTTPGQSVPFTNRGTIRWENLTSAVPESHFFYEHARAGVTDATDTLQILIPRGTVTQDTLLGAFCGEVVNITELAFLDTTFVRNSGDFTHAIMGEGGSSVTPALAFARAMGYDVTEGVLNLSCITTIIDSSAVPPDTTVITQPEQFDLGISRAVRLRDFIANTAIPVKSVATNFTGFTSLIRADSIYVLDENLRLQGIVSIAGINPGMDLNFDHAFDAGVPGTPTFGGTLSPNDRVAFAASDGPEILVFDTFFFEQIQTIQVRDPVIGPLRVAERAGGQQVLVGVTAGGILYVELPAITNPNPGPAWSRAN